MSGILADKYARVWAVRGVLRNIQCDNLARARHPQHLSTEVERLKKYCRYTAIGDIVNVGELSSMMAAASPKPRLPSPPPFTEVQSGPVSPGLNATTDIPSLEGDGSEQSTQEANGRIRPGTKAPDMAAGLPFEPANEVSAIKCLY